MSIAKHLENEKIKLKKYIQLKNPDIKKVEINSDFNEIKYWNEFNNTKVLQSIDNKLINPKILKKFKGFT